jgi:dihydrofolate reductase
VHDLDALKAEMKKRENEDIYVIGGAQIYRALLPYCEEVLVTKVDAFGGADAFFPNLDEDKNFTLSSESEPLEDNGYTLRFVVYKNLDTQTL